MKTDLRTIKTALNQIIAVLLLLAMLLQPCTVILANAEQGSGESYLSAGMREFKNSFSGIGTPSWILEKFGIEIGYHLLECATKKEKPDVIKVVKSMATADYLARAAGGIIGTATGSVFVPFLSSVPIFGGFLADFVPTFACYLGANMAGKGVSGLRNGNFSFKEYFKNLDWTAMAAGSLGWSTGSMLGSIVFPPVGSIVGGILGDFVATKLLEKFRKWRTGSDSSPPLMPTGTGGPSKVSSTGKAPEKREIAAIEGSVETKHSVADLHLNELSQNYKILYKQYQNELVSKNKSAANATIRKLNQIKQQLEKLRKAK